MTRTVLFAGEINPVEKFSHLMLDVWREVCRHLRIEESVDLVAPILARRLPVDLLLVRQIDAPRSLVETLAAGQCRPGAAAPRPKTEGSPEEIERLLLWCRRGEVLRRPARVLARQWPALLPPGIEGEVLVGPLATESGPAGVLVLTARPPHTFQADHEPLLKALLDPFAVAMENDHRLRELTSLREAVEADNRSLLSRLGRHDISDSIVGAETGLRPVMDQIELVARADAPVLVLGETGSGKEVVARAIHTRSRRSSGPFLRVNCGAIPPELVDSELFGHEKGSFTGATGVRKGWFERADGGTLFLDEVGELPPAAQVRLLRVLQDGQLDRVGSERSHHVDVRIVAATHRDLQGMVGEGRFREDLWYRIAVFPIRLPPLRDRREDIPALASHFALRAAKRLGTAAVVPSADDLHLLISYSWPGNVRELAAVIERAAILGAGNRLEIAQSLGAAPPRPPSPSPSPSPSTAAGPTPLSFAATAFAPSSALPTLDEAMARHIEAALARTRGRIEGPDGAAAALDINPHTLRARMRKLGVDWSRFRRRPRAADGPQFV